MRKNLNNYMDLYDQNLIPRIIFTVISVVLTIGPTIADFNKTHATHPDWTGTLAFMWFGKS